MPAVLGELDSRRMGGCGGDNDEASATQRGPAGQTRELVQLQSSRGQTNNSLKRHCFTSTLKQTKHPLLNPPIVNHPGPHFLPLPQGVSLQQRPPRYPENSHNNFSSQNIHLHSLSARATPFTDKPKKVPVIIHVIRGASYLPFK